MDPKLRMLIKLLKDNKDREFTAAELMKLFKIDSRFQLELMIEQAKQAELFNLKTTAKGWVL